MNTQAPCADWVEEKTLIDAVGWRIPAVVTLPAEGTSAGLVVLVPGSLYSDADGNYPMFHAYPHASRDLAREMAERGLGVIRYAKRGPGTGAEVVDPERQEEARQFRARVTVAMAALALLKDRAGEGAVSVPVVLAGHSEGAVVVLMAGAEGVDVDGIVSLSGPSVGIFSIMREQLGLPQGSAPEAYAAFDAAVAEMRAGRVPELDPQDPTLGSLAFVARSGPAVVGYMAQIDAVDPVVMAARVRHPVLLVQGGRDNSVPGHHVGALEAARGNAGLPTEVARFPALSHFYKVVPVGMDAMAAFMLDTDSDPAVAAAIARWMRANLER